MMQTPYACVLTIVTSFIHCISGVGLPQLCVTCMCTYLDDFPLQDESPYKGRNPLATVYNIGHPLKQGLLGSEWLDEGAMPRGHLPLQVHDTGTDLHMHTPRDSLCITGHQQPHHTNNRKCTINFIKLWHTKVSHTFADRMSMYIGWLGSQHCHDNHAYSAATLLFKESQ